MAAMSGLARPKRIQARDRAVQAAKLGLANASKIEYGQDEKRWEGITKKRDASAGQFPRSADCSSFVTWCLWNGLFLAFGLPDNVNGQKWKAGWTGTMRQHGRKLDPGEGPIRGDVVFYDPPHVAIVVSRKNNKPLVVSHGQDSGPHRWSYDYRRPVQIRRYI